MEVRRVVILLLAFALVAAASQWMGRSGWAWALVAGGAFVYGHVRTGSHELLAVGGALIGVAVGLAFGAQGWPGAFPLSVGAGLVTAERLTPTTGTWTLPAGAALLLAGLVAGVFASPTTAATALLLALLAAVTVLVARRSRGRRAATPPTPPRRHDDAAPSPRAPRP